VTGEDDALELIDQFRVRHRYPLLIACRDQQAEDVLAFGAAVRSSRRDFLGHHSLELFHRLTEPAPRPVSIEFSPGDGEERQNRGVCANVVDYGLRYSPYLRRLHHAEDCPNDDFERNPLQDVIHPERPTLWPACRMLERDLLHRFAVCPHA
jgi:hypothetical protein